METINVDIVLTGGTELYQPRYISFGNGHVIGCENSRNLGFMLGYCSAEEAEKRKKPIQAQMEQYNNALSSLWGVPGFP